MAQLDVSKLVPLNTSGLVPVDDKFDVSGLKKLDVSGLQPLSAPSEGYGDAFLYGVGQPIRNIGTTARVLGAEAIGGALESVPQPENYAPAGERVLNPQEGDLQIGGIGIGSIPRAAVEQAGQLAGSLLSRAAGAGIGASVAGPAGAVVGGIALPTVFGAAQVLGPVALDRAKREGRETPNRDDLMAALGTAVASGAIDAASAKFLSEAGGPVLKRLGFGFLTEGGTEATQSVVEQAGTTAGTAPGLEISPKQAIAEGLIGGFTGAGAAGVVGSNVPQEVRAEDEGEQEQAPSGGTVRMYRGVGKNLGDAGSTAFFTTDPKKAALYGDVGYVDVSKDELGNFAQGANGADEFVTDNPDFTKRLKPLLNPSSPPPPASLDPSTLGLPAVGAPIGIRWTENADPDRYQIEGVIQGDAEPMVLLRSDRTARVEPFAISDIKDLLTAPPEAQGAVSPKGTPIAEAATSMPNIPAGTPAAEAVPLAAYEQDAQLQDLTDQTAPNVPPVQAPPQMQIPLPDAQLREIAGNEALLNNLVSRQARLQPNDPIYGELETQIQSRLRTIADLRSKSTPKQTVQAGEPGGVRTVPLPGVLGAAAAQGKVGVSAAEVPLSADTTPKQPRIGSLTVPEGRPTVAETGETLTAPQNAPRPGLSSMPLESAMAGRASVAETGTLDTGPTVRTPAAPAPTPLEQGMAGRTSVADTGESITRPMTAEDRQRQRKLELERNRPTAKPDSLLDALKRIGLRRDDPALNDLRNKDSLPKSVFKKDGKTVAEALTLLESQGYPVKPSGVEQYTAQDVDALSEALDNEVAGRPVWSAENQQAGERWQEQQRAADERVAFEKEWGVGAVGRHRATLATDFGVQTPPNISLGEVTRLLEQKLLDAETDEALADNAARVVDDDARAADDLTPEQDVFYDPFDIAEAQDTDTRSTQDRVGAQTAGLQSSRQESEVVGQGQERRSAEDVAPEPIPEGDPAAIEDEDNAELAAAVTAAKAPTRQPMKRAPGRGYKPSERGGIYLGPKRQPMKRGEKGGIESRTMAIVDAMNERVAKMLGRDGKPASKQEMLNTTAKVNATVPENTSNPYNPGWDLSWASQLTTFMSGVAANDKNVSNYHQTVLDKHGYEHGIIKGGEDKLRPAYDLPESSRKKISAVMEHDRLLGVDRKNFKARVAVILPDNYKGDLGKPGQRIELSRAETDALKNIREFLDERFDAELQTYAQGMGYDGKLTVEAVQKQIEALTPDTQSKDRVKASAAKRKINLLGLVQAKIEGTTKAKRMGYVPFRRYGDVRITVNPELRAGVDADEKLEKTRVIHVETRPKWEFIYTGRADALRKYQQDQVNKAIAELRKKYPASEYKIGWQKVEDNPFESISIESLEELASAMAKLNDPQTADDIFEKVVKQMKKQLAASYKHMSENVPGYSTDFFRAIADHNRITAVVAAQQKFGLTQKQAYDAVQKNSGKNTKAFVERYNNYLDSDEAIIGRLKQFGFWANIWGSPSSAIVNLIQTPTITAAQIGAWGNTGAWARTNAMIGSVARAMRVTKDGATLDFDKIKFTNPDERKAFMAAVKAGTIDPGVAQDLMGDEPNKFGQKRETQEFFGRVFKIGASMFNSAEQVNRAVAWLSAYREIQRDGAMAKFMKMYAKDERVQNLRRQGRLEPADVATFVTNDTQFIGGKFDRPEGMRGIWGVAFQFKTYPLNYMRILYGNFTRMGREGKVAGLMMMAAMLGLSGLLGLPFAEDMLNLADGVGKFVNEGVDPMLEKEMRQFMDDLGWSTEGAESVLRGPSRMLGVDLSKRLGMGEITPEADLLMSIPILGATWGRMDEYYHRKESGQPIGAAIAAAAPVVGKGPADLARGLLQVPEEGLRTKYGDTRIFPSQITAGQMAAKSVGLQPASFARKQEKEFQQRRLERKTRDAETALRSKLSGYLADSIVARRYGDTERANDLMAKYRATYKDAYSAFRAEKVMEDKIRVPSSDSVRNRALEMVNEKMKAKGAPKTKRAALAEEAEDGVFLSGQE
jgi:hypothetical protein